MGDAEYHIDISVGEQSSGVHICIYIHYPWQMYSPIPYFLKVLSTKTGCVSCVRLTDVVYSYVGTRVCDIL